MYLGEFFFLPSLDVFLLLRRTKINEKKLVYYLEVVGACSSKSPYIHKCCNQSSYWHPKLGKNERILII
jgi:hypothetical protein